MESKALKNLISTYLSKLMRASTIKRINLGKIAAPVRILMTIWRSLNSNKTTGNVSTTKNLPGFKCNKCKSKGTLVKGRRRYSNQIKNVIKKVGRNKKAAITSKILNSCKC